MKKWKCTVCGYVHEGPEPPENCPVCGADKSKFVELPAEEASASTGRAAATAGSTAAAASDAGVYASVTHLMAKHHAHPIAVHIPNGLLPVSVLFIFGASLFNFPALAQAAYFNLVVVVLAMPLVLFSGYVDWQKRFGGEMTRFFRIKMICGAIVFVTALVLVIWQTVDSGVATSTGLYRLKFMLLNLIMLASAGTAGHLGGKLVFDTE